MHRWYLPLIAVVSCGRPPLASPLATPHAALHYPPAHRGPVVEETHGVKVADPYRWLEQLDAPETRRWVAAEDALTTSYLSRAPSRSTFRKRLAALRQFEHFSTPIHRGNRYYYEYNRGDMDMSVLVSTDGPARTPSVVLDPRALSSDGSVAVTGYVADREGTLLAYGVSTGASDWTDWHFRDLRTGKSLPDVIRWTKYYAPVFASGGNGVYYSAFPAPRPGEELTARDLGNAVFHHVFGTPQSSDRTIFERPDHPDWQYELHGSPDGRWLVVTSGEGQVGDKGRENVYALELGEDTAPAAIVEGYDAAYMVGGFDGDHLFLQTTLDAPLGRVIAVNLRAPARSQWREVVPEGRDAIDMNWGQGGVSVVGHQLIVQSLHDAHSKVTIYGLDGKLRRELILPGAGTVLGFEGEVSDRETFYSYQDYVTPPTIYRLDMETGASAEDRVPKAAFSASQFEVRQVFYSAKDGVRVPMWLAMKKGTRADATRPTLMKGYGGFGMSVTPWFLFERIAWLERGGIVAIPNIRGGGEYGEAWHQQAIRARKQVTFDDFNAAGEWLIEQGYTSPGRLAIEGESNGGLLVGACLTQRPELFGAVVAHVGVFDMLRFDRFGQGSGWTGDFGSPSDPHDFAALLAYSPYHNVRPGTRYPPTMLITADHDTRVMPAHSYKFAAALQAAQAGTAPILLRVERSSGHGGGTTVSQELDALADQFAFLAESLGMRESP